jgi:hypothetical protein
MFISCQYSERTSTQNFQIITQIFQKISLVLGYIFITTRPVHNGKTNMEIKI